MKSLSIFNNRGFTLIEMLVYMAILVVLATAAVGLMFSFSNLLTAYRVETALYRSGATVMEQVLVSIRQAEDFDSISSILDDPDNGLLVVTRGASSTEVALVGDTIELTIDGQNYGSSINPNVSVEHFTVFSHPTVTGDLVRVRIHLSASINGVTKAMTFYGGAIIRGAV